MMNEQLIGGAHWHHQRIQHLGLDLALAQRAEPNLEGATCYVTKVCPQNFLNFSRSVVGLVSFTPPVYLDRKLLPLTCIIPSSSGKMGKGKNHDRKANPGFGKTNGKSASSGGEFTLKRVKGEPRHIQEWVRADGRRELLPRCEEGVQGENAQWRKGGPRP